MALVLSNVTPVLKKLIIGNVRENVKRNALVWYLAGGSIPQDSRETPYQKPVRLNSEVIDWTNNAATIPLRLRRHYGIFGVTESNNNLVTADGVPLNAATVSAKYITGTFRISMQSMMVKEGTGASIAPLKTQVRALTTDYIHDLNRQFFGDGSGAIARVASNTAGNSTTLTLSKPLFLGSVTDNGDIDFSDYFEVGSIVKVGSTTAAVTAISANTLTVGTPILTAADTVYKSDAAGNASAEIDGLGVMVKSSGTYLSLSDSRWVAGKLTGQAAASNTLTEAMIDSTFISLNKVGNPDVIVMNQSLWQKYSALLTTYKRSANALEKYYGGTTGIKYAGGDAAVLLDFDCPDDAAYVLSTADLQLLQWKEFNIEDDDIIRVPGTLNYEIVGTWFGNMATGARKAHGASYNMYDGA